MRANTVKQISEREHMLLRPGQYIGATTITNVNTFIYDEKTNHFDYGHIAYVPALIKIISEIIDNSLDEAVRTNFKYANKINVTINNKEIEVEDNGRGIPLTIDKTTGISQLELAVAYPRAGSNFNDAERDSIGMNGIGSYATNVMSKNFKAVSVSAGKRGVIICSNNLLNKNCKISDTTSGKFGTTVTFEPDLKRFGLKEIDNIHQNLIYQRILFLSIAYPEITFKFNGKTIKFRNTKNFLSSFNEKFVQINDEKFLIGIIPNTSDDFNSKSLINGADCINGGNHIDYIHSELISRIKTKLEKKYPSIKIGDIKNKLTYIVTIRGFMSPLFDSQTKEKFTSNISDIKSFFGEIDWDKITNQIIKTPELIDPIIETFKIREELKHRQALNKLNNGSKNFKCDKFLPATKDKKYLIICEGLSAQSGLCACLGRSLFGFFASRGVPLNAYDANLSDLIKNEELSNIIKILNVEVGKQINDNMNYQNIVIGSDSDSDGYHITSLYIGFFLKYFPQIIKNHKLFRLRTPIIALKDKNDKINKFFFTLNEYNDYIKTNNDNKNNLRVHYFKGLGSWEPEDLSPLITKYGIEYFLEEFEFDKTTPEIVDDWLNSKNADKRKEYLRQNEFSIFNI